jgi:hypothetical protein
MGGAAAVNERWAKIPQLADTRLQPLDANRFYVGNSTPSDSLWAISQLLKKQDSYAKFLKDTLRTNIYADFGVRTQLSGNDHIVLVNKVGILDDDIDGNNRHDVGIIYNVLTKKSYAYSFFTTSAYADAAATPQAERSLKDMGRYTLRYAGDKKKAGEEQQLRTQQAPQAERRILY